MRSPSSISRLAWLMLAAALVGGCAGSDPASPAAGSVVESSAGSVVESSGSGTRVFAADNGDITIPADPQRVVATGYAVPVLIEADAALVGISSWKRGTPLMTAEDLATYNGLPSIAGESALETNYEAIAAVSPDLIVIGVPAPALVDIDLARLEAIAPVVAIGPTVPSAWREQSRRQADAAGRLDNFDAAKVAYETAAAELADKYKEVFADLKFGHVGAYGEVSAGNFMREFAGSWGTNIAGDIGINYYGEVAEKVGGAGDVSEYPSIEELSSSLGEADVITYSLATDGTVNDAVQFVLDSPLWANLPAVQAGKSFPIQYTEAATYTSALKTLDSIDKSLSPLLGQ